MIKSWYLQGIDYDAAPGSLKELEEQAACTQVSAEELLAAAKWEHLLQGRRAELPPGWINLSEVAQSRRGIATGSNSFFLITKEAAVSRGLRPSSLLPCVGRANDVSHLIFTTGDFETLSASGGKTQLVNLTGELTPTEATYVAMGEQEGLPSRFLLSVRKPWYSMEKREIAPIWAAVFGRGDLKFVFNQARVRSLTNFHCLYPACPDEVFVKALVFCLNTNACRERSRLATRVYGGGLNKFEPKDLMAVQIPDLRAVGERTLSSLADALDALDASSRRSRSPVDSQDADALVWQAAEEAATRHTSSRLL